MADLKAGTTVAGSALWHQGNFPLFPAGNSLTYRGFKVYTENDKPQAVDNDFVSKASGGAYLGKVSFNNIDNIANLTGLTGTTPGIQFDVKSTAGAGQLTTYSWQMYANSTLFNLRHNNGGTYQDILKYTLSTGTFDVYGSIKLAAASGSAFYDATGFQVYSPQNKPTPAAIGAVALDAVVDFGTY